MGIILLFIAAFVVCSCIACFSLYVIHLSFRQYYDYDYVTFDTFQKKYEDYIKNHNLVVNMTEEIMMGEMGKYTMLSLHLIKFEGEIMILKPWSYIKYCFWFTKQISIKNNRKIGLWSQGEKNEI